MFFRVVFSISCFLVGFLGNILKWSFAWRRFIGESFWRRICERVRDIGSGRRKFVVKFSWFYGKFWSWDSL